MMLVTAPHPNPPPPTSTRYAFQSAEEGCAIALHGIDLPTDITPLWIFGQQVFRGYAGVFDFAQRRVGLGKLRRDSSTDAETEGGEGRGTSTTISGHHHQQDGADLYTTSNDGSSTSSRLAAKKGIKTSDKNPALGFVVAEACAGEPLDHVVLRRSGAPFRPKVFAPKDDASLAGQSIPRCEEFAHTGFCKRFVTAARDYCPVSCGVCSPAGGPAGKGPAVSLSSTTSGGEKGGDRKEQTSKDGGPPGNSLLLRKDRAGARHHAAGGSHSWDHLLQSLDFLATPKSHDIEM